MCCGPVKDEGHENCSDKLQTALLLVIEVSLALCSCTIPLHLFIQHWGPEQRNEVIERCFSVG